jgi:hypothetical protein
MQPLIGQRRLQKSKYTYSGGPKIFLNRNVKHCLERALNFLKKILRALFRMRCVLLAWEHPGVIPARTVLRKDLSSYRSLNILETICIESEIMLGRTISDLRSHGLLSDEQMEFRIYSRTSERLGCRSSRFNIRIEG